MQSNKPTCKSSSTSYVSDTKWFAARPLRTHRLRNTHHNELKTWAGGSTHITVTKLKTGSLAKVPVDLSSTCKQCVAQVVAIADLNEESILDLNIKNLMQMVLAGRPPSIEMQFWVAMSYHSNHCKKLSSAKTSR